MNLATAQRDQLHGAAVTALKGSWLIQDESKRVWLARECRDAIDHEFGQFAGILHDRRARNLMIAAVKKRIHERNKECDIVILTIILGAVLSWLIQRLLDDMF